MRAILFRGKRLDNGLWIEGCLRQYLNGRAGICCNKIQHLFLVDPATVGQYTGLKDKNGQRIFEGDIVRCESGRICEVVYFTSPGIAQFDLKPIAAFDKPYPVLWNLFSGSEVIGNIYDNPELLK